MKTLPAGLQAHLDGGATTLAWCWKITPVRGPLPDIAFTNSFMWPDGDPYDWHIIGEAVKRDKLPPRYGTWQIAPFNPPAETIAAFVTDPYIGAKVAKHHDGDFLLFFDIDISDLPAGTVVTYSDVVQFDRNYNVTGNDQIGLRVYTEAEAQTFDVDGFMLTNGTTIALRNQSFPSGTTGFTLPRSLSAVLPAGKKMLRIWTSIEGSFWVVGFYRYMTIVNPPVLAISAYTPDGALGFTDHDRSLAFDGTDFEPDSGLVASTIRAGADLAVDAQDAMGALSSERITETDIASGYWDNAEVQLWRVNWADTSQRVLMRRGNLGQVRRGNTGFTAEARSMAHYLNQPLGRTYQYYCDAVLGDARCGIALEAAAYKATGSVAALDGDRGFTVTGIEGFVDGWFSAGTVEWTSGANAGATMEVADHQLSGPTAGVTLAMLPVKPIAVGDAFTLRAGCDKQFSTCGAKFANAASFRGFPHIPGQDSVVRYARSTGSNDGSVLS